MNALLDQLGINWQLLLSQAVNFFILLIVLYFAVYKPLLKIIKERREKIEVGLQKAEEADVRLREIDNVGKEKIKQAEQESIKIISKTEEKARVLADDLQKKAEEKQKEVLAQIEKNKKLQEEEAKQQVLKGAGELVKKAIAKTVELGPDKIDEALINKAILKLKHEK